MKGSKGIENPAFVASSPDTPHRLFASPSHVEVSDLAIKSQGPNSKPQEPPEPQTSPEAPQPSAAPSASQELSRPESPPEFEEGPCGCGNLQPQCLQPCNTPQGFLLFYCLLALTQGIVVNGLVNISISTIEKRYEMKSSLTGLISSSYDISFCVLSLFVSFFGERGHKPRWLAFASFMIGLGALVFSLPKFFSGKYQLGSLFEDTCSATRNGTGCTSSSSSLSNYVYVFILGQLLLGTGGTPLYTLGTAFIDDSVPTHKSSLYIGIGYSMSVLGPAIGYVLGGQLLSMYIDVNMGQRSTAKIQGERISQTHQDKSSSLKDTEESFGTSFKDFPAALKFFSTSSEGLITTGFATFLPKFIENQFGLSSSFAATLGGAVLIPGAALGQILGGVFVSKLKMTCKNTMKFALLTSLVALVLSFVFVYANCENEPFAGVSESYNGEYYNCSCIARNTEITPTSASFISEAKAGKCESRCANLPIFLGIFFATIIFTFMAGTPITVSILRCTIPGPIIFGITIDSTCVLWDINECGTRGACWIYDNIKMAYMLVAISVTCKIITVFFNGCAIFLYKPPPLDTDVSFQSQNAVVTVSVECDLSNAGNEG
ncbi:solute carrier organic anion transporter family member 4C1 isoform X2 [Prionailurus iriomotensis]